MGSHAPNDLPHTSPARDTLQHLDGRELAHRSHHFVCLSGKLARRTEAQRLGIDFKKAWCVR